MEKFRTHPVKTDHLFGQAAKVPQTVSLAAYEVRLHVYGPQEVMMPGDCQNEFTAGQLVAFLYARSFPKSEWSVRVAEALHGMDGL